MNLRFVESPKETSEEKLNQNIKPKNTEKKVSRNEPCPCGSGKKFKRCCGSL